MCQKNIVSVPNKFRIIVGTQDGKVFVLDEEAKTIFKIRSSLTASQCQIVPELVQKCASIATNFLSSRGKTPLFYKWRSSTSNLVVAKKRSSAPVYFIDKEMEQIMSSLKDPYDTIEWNPNRGHNTLCDSRYRGERSCGRINAGAMGRQHIGQFYDLIFLCTLVAALAAFFGLLLSR